MPTIHIALTARTPAEAERVADHLAEHARRSRAEPGCERFEVYRSNRDPHAFFILETWASESALDVHRRAESILTIYEPQVLPLVDRAAHPVTSLPV